MQCHAQEAPEQGSPRVQTDAYEAFLVSDDDDDDMSPEETRLTIALKYVCLVPACQ